MNEEHIRKIIIEQLGDFNTPPIATHEHNGWDANQLNPKISLTGFPVYSVADASVSPTDKVPNGTFRFQTDFKSGTAHFYFWAYLVYVNTTTYISNAKWVGVSLS